MIIKFVFVIIVFCFVNVFTFTFAESNKINSNNSTFIFSPYKDTSINMDWNTNIISTKLNNPKEAMPSPLVPFLQSIGNHAITLAFASGTCQQESWGGVPGQALANANLPLLQKDNINYIIASGGAAGTFTCNSVTDLENFVNRYREINGVVSPNFVGLDYDIEGGNQQQIQTLIKTTADLQKQQMPSLRVSLTVATLANGTDTLNVYGQWALAAAKDSGLNYDVNLMVMDYGGLSNCQLNKAGNACDMALSASYAAKAVSAKYNIPLSHIELTPMIGDNDSQGETTSVDDLKAIAQFVKANNLAGLHYWSFDRDTPCHSTSNNINASPICNNVPGAETLAYDKAVLSVLN